MKLQKALKPEEFAAAMVNVTNRFLKTVVLMLQEYIIIREHLVQGTKTGKLGQAVPRVGGALQVCS